MADSIRDPITKGREEKELKMNTEGAYNPLARRVINRGRFQIDGVGYFSSVLLKYEGKVFAVYAYDQAGNAVGIIERSGSTCPYVVPLLDGVPHDLYEREMSKYLCVVEGGGVVSFLGKLFLGKGLEQYEGEVVTILPPDDFNEPYLAEIDGQLFELLDDVGKREERFLEGKALQVADLLCGMSIAQAELVLQKTWVILKNQICISHVDVDEAKRRHDPCFGSKHHMAGQADSAARGNFYEENRLSL